MPVRDRSAMTFHLSRGQLIGRLDLTTPLEADRPVGCPSGHIAAPLTSATVIREAAQNAGAEARVPDASKQRRHVGIARGRQACSALGGFSPAVNRQSGSLSPPRSSLMSFEDVKLC
jgi:hypothetical protein